MQDILQTAFSMPTLIFSVLLIPVTLYWVVSLLGIFDLDLLDIADAADGLDVDFDADTDGPGFLDHVGFGDVPRSFTGSLMIVFAWSISLGCSLWIPGFQDKASGAMWITALVAAGSLLLATGATAVAIQPMRKAMQAGVGTRNHELVGRLCTVTTQRVDDRFGQAEVDGGNMLVQVRCLDADDEFERGMRAMIFQYDAVREVFLIAPLPDELARPQQA